VFDIEFQRGFAFAFLALPTLLWVLARRPRPPHELATGTLSIWREVLEQNTATPVTRGRGVPPGLYWCLLALLLGTLALAGPHRRHDVAPEWRVVLDTRPQMFLPWRTESPVETGKRRIDVALARAQEWIAGAALWMRYDGEGFEQARGDEPPADWLLASNHSSEAMPWSGLDRADSLWVSDRELHPRGASWVASGGAAADGVVGRRDGRSVSVRAGELVDGEPDPVSVSIDARVPHELRRLTEAWAGERGMRVLPSKQGAELVVHALPARAGKSAVRGNGWELSGVSAEAPSGRTLWRDANGAAVLTITSGELHLALGDPLVIEGDRRAFGLAWIEVLESSVLPPRGAVSIAARRSAGAGGEQRGAGPSLSTDSSPGPWASWLALAACLAAALGLRLRALRT